MRTRALMSLLLAVLLAMPVLVAHAALPGATLYHATVPVADAGAAARGQAIAQAAASVLVKLSGDPRITANPAVATALQNATALVANYRYLPGGGNALLLDVGFDPQALLGLARQLALPVWPAPRPPVLVLATINGQPLDASGLAAMQVAGDVRGIRFIVPGASGAPAADALAAATPQAMDALARDYATGIALVGRVQGNQGQWTLVIGERTQSWQSAGGSSGAALVAAANAAADRLVARFAAAPAAPGGAPGRLWVGDLRSAQDYAALMALLRRDPRIRSVQPLQAQGDSLLLALQLDAPLATVAADLSAGGHLVTAPAQPAADVALDWVR